MSTSSSFETPSGQVGPDDINAAISAHARWLADPDQDGARQAIFNGRQFVIGADFNRADLSGASFVKTDLRGARLAGATLIGVDFSGANLEKADLSRADLTGAVLLGTELSGADLSGATLQTIRASDSRWRYATLTDANLFGAQLMSADLTEARLDRTRLVRADLSSARLTGARCYAADFHFANLRGATATGADFREARLTGSDRTDADFSGAAFDSGLRDWAARALGGARDWAARQAGEYRPSVAELAAARVLGDRLGGMSPDRASRLPPAVPDGVRSAKKEFSARELRDRPMPTTGLDYLLSAPTPNRSRNLVGVGIGEKVRGGERTGAWAVVFFVRHKLPAARVPEAHRLPSELGGFPTDVVDAGVFRLHSPGPGNGISADKRPGNPPQIPGWGTLGTLVRIRPTLAPVHLLSAAHVLTDANRQPGPGTVIFAPPIGASGFAAVATLRATCLADRYRAAKNDYVTVDGGVAEFLQDLDDATLKAIQGLPSGLGTAKIGTDVEKTGLNGRTDGTIAYTDVDIKNFLTPVPHPEYLNQILIRPQNATSPFSQQGDSGSLIVTREERAAVALLIGESFDGIERLTFAAPIEEVLTALDAELITQ
jgi:uncharacterized protein YjbI with pentapeptide repeats